MAMNAMPHMRVAAIAIGIVALAACTTVSDEKEVIAAFSTATVKATDALAAYDAATAARETVRARAVALTDKDGIRTLDERKERCTTTSNQCELFYQPKPADLNGPMPDLEPLTIKSLIPDHIKAAQAIAGYAKALKEVADADAREQVRAALDKATTAVSSLANIVEPGSGPGVKAIAGPSANALAWLYGKYQEQMKLNALREATKEMNPIIQRRLRTYTPHLTASRPMPRHSTA
jgi:hypothetical protein